jgi:hypothetical protein
VIDFSSRNCLTESSLCAGALSSWRIQWLGQSSDLLHCSLCKFTQP